MLSMNQSTMQLPDMEDSKKFMNTLHYLTMKNENSVEEKVIETLKLLHDKGVNTNVTNKYKTKILESAVKKRMNNVIEFLLSHDTNINSVIHSLIEDEYKKFRKLSIDKNNLEKSDSKIEKMETESSSFIEWLISKGFDFDTKNKIGQSAIFVAIERNLQHILPVLLKSTKHINFVDKINRTLLHLFLERSAGSHRYYVINKNWYSKRYTVDIVKILLERGVSVDAEDVFECTPIRLAIENREDFKVVEILLSHSTNFEHRDSNGETLFDITLKKWATSNRENADYYVKIARVLIAKGVNVNEPDEHYGKTPLVQAIQSRSLPVVEFLKDNGADFSVITKKGESLMHFLVMGKYCDETRNEMEMKLVDVLIEQATNVHQKNCKGQTSFHLLIERWSAAKVAESDYYMKIARALIAKGVDVNEGDKFEKRPIFHAVQNHNLPVVEFLREHGADFSATTECGKTLMHLLVPSKRQIDEELQIELFDVLIGDGCLSNAKDKTGLTPLHLAVDEGSTAIVRKLLEHGAGVNCRNHKRETPLIYLATKSMRVDMAQLLLEHGANVDAKDRRGFTALCCAATHPNRQLRNLRMLRLLLEHGADIGALDRGGHSVLRMAIWYDYNQYQPKDRQISPDNLPRLDDDFVDRGIFREVDILLKHQIKLEVANLPGYIRHEYNDLRDLKDYQIYYEIYWREVEMMRNIEVDDCTTLYSLLRVDPNSRRAYIYSEERQNLLHSSKLKQQFPKYASLILASYHEAVTRGRLLEPAKKAWLELTKIHLPDVCIECILSFLRNSDLFVMTDQE